MLPQPDLCRYILTSVCQPLPCPSQAAEKQDHRLRECDECFAKVLRMCAQAEAYRLLSEASQRLEAGAKTGGESEPDGAADAEAAYTGMTPQANSIMSAAKCSVLLANMQVPTSSMMLYENELKSAAGMRKHGRGNDVCLALSARSMDWLDAG